jgi:L-rhamnose mutarotase
MKRVASVIGIPTENFQEYAKHHSAVWPEVLHKLTECNVKNYSIFVFGELLFSYFEYVGEDFDADMERMAADPITQDWWAIQKPLQKPVETRKDGEWWHELQEVFHLD